VTTLRLATPADDDVIRALLRDNAMPSWVEMTIEREPSFFAGANLFGRDWAVIAEEDGDVVGMYSAAMMPLHVDGRAERLGYLGGLRVSARHRRRIRHLRAGYESIVPLAPARVPFWFTVVGEENRAAKRLLEAGVAGLPAYHAMGEYRTFAISTSRGRRRGSWRRATDADAAEIVALYNARAAQYQFSPVLDEEIVRRLPFFVCPGGVAALWDQRAFKQIVARRYRTPKLIAAYNVFARLSRRVVLPREGGALDQTFIAFLALDDHDAFADLLSHCTTPVASIGLHAAHPVIRTIERMKPMSYPARVYAVTFNGVPPLTARPAQPEAALL
jgi:hypothetical protein